MFPNQERASSVSPEVCSAQQSGPVVPSRFELGITVFGLIFTIIATAMAGLELARVISENVAAGESGLIALHLVFALVIALLVYGSFVYQFARFGCLWRERNHRPETLASLETIFDRPAKPLTVLVPSYMEDPEIVFTTLMSAALQDYPERQAFNDALPHNTGGSGLMNAVERFIEVAQDHKPDLIFVAGGADAHWNDPLSSLQYHLEDYEWSMTALREAFRGKPFLFGGAGGYQPDGGTPLSWATSVTHCS